MNQGFAKALVEDYAALGWGTPVSDYALKGESGDEVEFAVVGEDDGTTDAIEVYHNGDLLKTISYDEEDFGTKLALLVSNLLEPSQTQV